MQSNRIIWQGPLAVALSSALFACASSSGGPASRSDRVETVTIESQTASANIALRPDLSGSRAVLEFPSRKVWNALTAAYTALPIPINAVDSVNRLVSGSARIYRQFLGRPLSRFIDCGTTIVGPSADSYNVLLSVKTQVDSVSPSTSILRTWVEATGSSAGGGVRCASSGALEHMIEEQVSEFLGGTAQ
jgi:hypothetical protein